LAAERKLFELYYGYVLSICKRYGNTKEEVEEMLNDSFYTVFRYLDRYDEQYDFKPWLRKVAINSCLQYLKKYNINFHTEELTDKAEYASAELADDISYNHIYKLINRLPHAYRIVFNLYVIEEYKHSEIAEFLGISVGTSKSNLSRAKRKLEKIIKGSNLISSKKNLANGGYVR